jgi:hypothetical protein
MPPRSRLIEQFEASHSDHQARSYQTLTATGSSTLINDAQLPGLARGRPNSAGGNANRLRSTFEPLASCHCQIGQEPTHLVLYYPLNRLRSICPVIRFDHVEHRCIRMGDEFPRSICQGNRVLLELFTQFRNGENSTCQLITSPTHLKVLPEIPIRPSGHMLAVRVCAYSKVS